MIVALGHATRERKLDEHHISRYITISIVIYLLHLCICIYTYIYHDHLDGEQRVLVALGQVTREQKIDETLELYIHIHIYIYIYICMVTWTARSECA